VPSERCSIELQSIDYCVWACRVNDVVHDELEFITHHVTRQNTSTHNILLMVLLVLLLLLM
jgi:hypothetical protein